MPDIPEESYEAAANRLLNSGELDWGAEASLTGQMLIAEQLKRIADSLDSIRKREDLRFPEAY